MALIDLSKFDVQAQAMPAEKQVFSDQGATAYKAMAQLGKGVADVALDLYAKHQDVLTDKEALTATNDYQSQYASESERALQNINPDTDFVEGTNKHYHEYMAEFSNDLKSRISEGMSERMSRGKFDTMITPVLGSNNVKAITTSNAKTVENTIKRSDKQASKEADVIVNSDSGSLLRNYNQAQDRLGSYYKLIEKTSGVVPSNQAYEKNTHALLKTALETGIRNATNGDTDTSAFSALLGPVFKFKDDGEYKRFVQKTYAEMGGTGNPELDKTFIDTMESLRGKNESYPPVKGAELFTPEEKELYMKKMLEVKWKTKKLKSDSNDQALRDWNSNTGEAGSAKHISEFQKLVTSDDFQGNNETRVRKAYEYADKIIEQELKNDFVHKGKDAFESGLQDIEKRRAQIAGQYLNGLMSQEEFESINKTTSVGKYDATKTMDFLRTQSKEWNNQANTDPVGMLTGSAEYTDKLSQAVVLNPTSGKLMINPAGMTAYRSYISDKLKTLGTAQAKTVSDNLMPPKMVNDVFEMVNTYPPADQINFYKSLNLGGPLAASYYQQLVKQGKMTVEQASDMFQLSVGDNRMVDALNSKIISVRNKYTGPGSKEVISHMKAEGFLFKDYEYQDILKDVSSNVAENEYMKQLKEIARASGASEDQIKNLWQDKNITLLAVDKLANNNALGDADFNTAFNPFSSGLNGRIKGAVNDSVTEYYKSRILPISGPNVKAIALPDSVDPVKVSEGATALADKLKADLLSGRVKVDFSDYAVMKKAGKYRGLSQDLMQRSWLRDVVKDISFNGTDVTGKVSELVAMFKDTDGNYFRIKLLTPDGKSSKVVTFGNAKELQSSDHEASYQKLTKDLIHTEQLGKISKDAVKPAVEPSSNLFSYNPDAPETGAPAPKPINPKAPLSPAIQSKRDIAAVNMISQFEGLKLKAYDDGAGNWSIGYGTPSKKGETITKDEAQKRMVKHINSMKGTGHLKDLKVELTDNQYAALMSLSYNMRGGTSHKAVGEVVDLLNKGQPEEAARTISKYRYARDKETGRMLALKGLSKRRAKEGEALKGKK